MGPGVSMGGQVGQAVIGLATSAAVLLALSGRRRARRAAALLGLMAQPAWFAAVQWPEQWGLMVATCACTAAWCAGVWFNRPPRPGQGPGAG